MFKKIVLSFCFALSFTLGFSQIPDYNNPDVYAKEVFDAVKSNNRSPLNKFLLRKDEDKEFIKDQYLKSDPDTNATPVYKAIAKIIEDQKWDLEKDFTALTKKGQSDQIYWAKAIITSIKYTPVVKKKAPVPETLFVVDFSSKGQNYKVSWKAIKGKSSWLMSKDLKLE